MRRPPAERLPNQTNADSTTIAPLDVSGFFADVDTTDSISFSSTTLPPGLSINSTTGVITGTLPANASDSGPYSVTIVGTDGSGSSTTQTFTWTVTNPTTDCERMMRSSGTENASLSGNVITDDNGSGVDRTLKETRSRSAWSMACLRMSAAM